MGAGYTEFKRKHDAEEAAARKKQRRIEQRIRPKEKKYFIEAATFEGWKFDYVFTTREGRGTGYYWDGMDSLKKLKGIEDFPAEEEKAPEKEGDTNDSNGVEKKKKKKKGKKRKSSGPVFVDDPNNPLEQVARAIQKRQAALQSLPSQLLPSGWDKAQDPTTGKPYYFNKTTGERQWDPPLKHRKQQEAPLPDGWSMAKDESSGKTYYYNGDGETRWERPTAT